MNKSKTVIGRLNVDILRGAAYKVLPDGRESLASRSERAFDWNERSAAVVFVYGGFRSRWK